MIRVVVPVHCEERGTVAQCVSALQKSSIAETMELVLADDTEREEWESFARKSGTGWKGTGGCGSAACARNAGARGFEGKVLVFVDADVIVEPQAIGLLVEPILSGAAEATVGNYTDRVRGMNFASTYKHLYIATVYARRGTCRNEFWSALGAVRRDTFERMGGFAAGFPGAAGEDTEFGCRLTAAGLRVMTVNAARAMHLKRYALRSLVLNDFRKGSQSAGLLLAKRVPLTDFRHSSRRDIGAVVLGVCLAGLLLAGATAILPVGLMAAAVVGALYLHLRSDLVRTFYRQSALFLAGAVPLMWVLDLVRAASIASVVTGLCLHQVAGLLRRAHLLAGLPRPHKTSQRMKLIAGRVQALTRLLAPWPAMPVYALVYVTQRCDARCRHCFLWRDLNKHTRSELTVEEFERLAASMGPLLQLTLTGGSPELRADLPTIARVFYRKCRPANLTICVNGYHTDRIRSQIEEILDSCPDQHLTVGVSLDGLGAVHDEIRGMKGLFERVLATFRELGRLKLATPRLSLTCAVCVSELNWETAEATADWAHEHLPIDLLKPILVRGQPLDPHALGSHCAATYQRLVEREAERLTRGKRTLLARANRAKEAVQRELITEFQREHRYCLQCAAGRQTTVIHADGTVMGCELRKETLGRLAEADMDLRRIWNGCSAGLFRENVRREKCACHHHCFLAPAVFRNPRLWPKLARAMLATC